MGISAMGVLARTVAASFSEWVSLPKIFLKAFLVEQQGGTTTRCWRG